MRGLAMLQRSYMEDRGTASPHAQPTLFKCEQTHLAVAPYSRAWDSMDDTSQSLKSWVTFAGCVLVVVVLYWAQAVLVPIALALLLTFVLARVFAEGALMREDLQRDGVTWRSPLSSTTYSTIAE